MDDRESSVRAAITVVTAIVIVTVTSVVGFAVHRAARTVAPAALGGQAPEPVGEALAKIYFEIGKAELVPEAGGALHMVLETARTHPGKIVLISGFHDPSGDPVKNTELAKNRAVATRDMLVELGLAAERIRLRKPEAATGGGDAQEERRVEIRVQ